MLYRRNGKTVFQCSCCCRVIIWAGCILNLILVATVIVLALQWERTNYEADVCRSTGSCPVKCNDSLADFQSRLKSRLCHRSHRSFSGKLNSSCKLCPVQWQLHRETCYWLSEEYKSWGDSQNDCIENNSQLLVMQDTKEMDLIKQMTKGTDAYWIGLSMPSPKNKWMWITGSQFDENMFGGPKATEKNSCATIQKKINVDKCTAVRRWICQKKAFFL